MTKKSVLKFIILLIAIVAFMLIPKEKEIEEDAQPSATQSAETSNGTDNTDDEEQQEGKKETFGGIRIGTSNLIVLIVLGSILAVNKAKEIKAGQSQEKD